MIKIRLVILALTILVVTFFISSPPPSLATCTLTEAAGKICLEANGLLTTGGETLNEFSTTGSSIVGSPAKIPQFSLPTYAEMKSLYFDQAKNSSTLAKKNYSSPTMGNTDFNTTTTASGIVNFLVNVPGDLTITENISGLKNVVFFINGDLLIKPTTGGTDLLYNAPTPGPDPNLYGLVFIVGGGVYIDSSVGVVNAFLINHGQFCDSSSGGLATISCGSVNKLLTINGSVISLSNPPVLPLFLRTNEDNTNPAEIINYDPKYLVVLKDVFSRNLAIWSEVQ